MPNPKRLWTDYPEQYLALAKSVATTPLPSLYGPFPRAEALAFRRNFYRFREALRGSVSSRDGSYPARLYEMIETLAVKIEPSPDDPSLCNVVFDLDPVVSTMDKLDPASAQMRALSRAHFAAAQRPSAISSPIFSDEEMRERLDEIDDKPDPH